MSLKRRRRQAVRRRQEREAQRLAAGHQQPTIHHDNQLSEQEETKMETQSHEKKLTTRESILDKLAGGKKLTRQELFEAVRIDTKCTNDAVRNAVARLVVNETVIFDGLRYSMRTPEVQPAHNHHDAPPSDAATATGMYDRDF